MIRDVLAVVEDPAKAEPFLESAIGFAERQGAHLEIAVLTPNPVTSPALLPLGGLFVPDEALARDNEAAIDRVRRFAARATCPMAVFGLRDEVAWLAGDVRESRQIADVILVGDAESWELGWLRRRVLETLILSSGTPILLVPSRRRLMQVRHAVLGWKPSPEANRAVHDLVRIAEPGARIDILTVDRKRREEDIRSGAEIERHLARHGFAPELHRTSDPDLLEVDMLQQFALEVRADLLAIGGFAHSRIREVVLGGVTRDMIDRAHLPTLLSH